MAREISGRRFLITGASGGIGRSLAEQLAAEGARLALVARTRKTLDALCDGLYRKGAEAHAIVGDVSSEADRDVCSAGSPGPLIDGVARILDSTRARYPSQTGRWRVLSVF